MTLSLEELLEQRKQLDAAIESARSQARESGLQTIREIVQRLGLTREDLDPLFRVSAPVQRAAPAAPGTGKQRHPNHGVKLPPKYMDPATGNKWSGRGLKPRWITDLESKGKSIEEFRVPDQ